MTAFIFVLVIVSAVAVCTLLWICIGQRKKLNYYKQIQDAEAYQSSCEEKAKNALEQHQKLSAHSDELTAHIAAQKTKAVQYQQLLGKFHTASELEKKINDDNARVQQLVSVIGKLEHAVTLHDYIKSQETEIAHKKAELDSLSTVIGTARTTAEVAAKAKYYENLIAQLKADVEAVEETKSLQEFGFYRSRYNFESAELYQDRLEQIRAKQKSMLTDKAACTCSTEWVVEGSKSEGKKMVNQQIKLMLRAFNGECDAAVSKVRYNNIVSLENRVRRSFEAIDKLGETKRIHMSPTYSDLKFEELRLAYEYQQKKEQEKEEQRHIREQMREEEVVAREIEKARESAEREEEQKTRALEQARAELEQRAGQQTEKLEALVARLENELKEVLDKKAKAIARAQLTKSGHVYILSNIGAFGDGVYKIGMSRRLEPLERVYELGGASVPFPFDVHAMIYSENAPELECSLHNHFANRRINMINLRREFFRVTLDEVRAAVAQYFGQVTFVLEPEAEQYRLTQAMLKDAVREQSQLQIA